jgi:shikimate kinase
MGRNLVLIGFMGTGKTSVGKALARRLGRPLVDIDAAIEQAQKRKIREIFAAEGEAHFRRLESAAIREAAARSDSVITTGGGAVLDPENFRALRANGWIVALSARPETIHARVKDSHQRPLLAGGADMLGEIRRLLEARAPLYREADYFFDTDGKNPAQMAELILESVGARLK